MYVVVIVAENYPDLMVLSRSVASQWGKPLQFQTKNEARELAREWAGVVQSRKVVVRPADRHPPVPFPNNSARKIIRRAPKIIRRT